MSAAATDVASIGSVVATANRGVAGATTEVLAAAEDEVSTAIAAVFSAHGQGYQALSSQAAAYHQWFVQALAGASGAYSATEAANASPLAALEQALLGVQQEIQQIPTALGNGFSQGFDVLFADPHSPLLALLTGDNPFTGIVGTNNPPRVLTLLLGETVQHTTYNGMPVVQITPAHPNGDYVVAIHGGAFILPPSIFHWIDYTVMAYQTGATIEVPIYPLLQQGGTAGTVVPNMAGFIDSQITAHPGHVSVTGDSAGGNLALAAAEYALTHGEQVPSSIVLLSPWLDLAHDGGQIGRVWAGGLSVTDPEVSPLYASPAILHGLPPTYVYSGSFDSLYNETLALQQKALAVGAPMGFVLAQGQVHDWILLTPTGPRYWAQIDQELGLVH
ncbi:lipase [Mycobacterium sp. IEC1808]|uniref:triacylglycerol lipase LipY n=1 Tax=Mycobacterium sp. IEC1808 TaxID=1743230 RepID=UPI000A2434D3|nr:PE domain-containing protein [Mycobacterium sp. IEC1808]ORW94390.1 lipase [Mycobacterium sp. IEC1808]